MVALNGVFDHGPLSYVLHKETSAAEHVNSVVAGFVGFLLTDLKRHLQSCSRLRIGATDCTCNEAWDYLWKKLIRMRTVAIPVVSNWMIIGSIPNENYWQIEEINARLDRIRW